MDAIGGLASAARARWQRQTDPGAKVVGGPAPDPAWDQFFGMLQDHDQQAHDVGLNTRLRFAPSSIAALKAGR